MASVIGVEGSTAPWGDPRVRNIPYKQKLASSMPKAAWREVGKTHRWRAVVLKAWFLG